MKLCICTCVFLIASNFLHAQPLDKGYYIVVGAFAPAKESYAQKFTDQLKKDGLDALYALDTKRNILLVYIKEYEEYSPSIKEMLAVRAKARFPEAWVRIIKDPLEESEKLKVKSEKLKEVGNNSEQKFTEGTSDKTVVFDEVPEPKSEPDLKSKPDVKSDSVVSSSPPIFNSSPPNVTTSSPSSSSPRLIFHMFDANNSEPVDGKIEVVDTERARLIQKNKSTDTLALPDPASKSKMLSFITDVFGYRKIQHEISYQQPLVDSAKHYFDQEGNYYVLQFEMVRYHKGDIATLYNVFFFNDAAIMMPESRYELNKLLDMMQSNKNYRIMLHGHTNGNTHGKIMLMGPSKEFFSAKANDVKQSTGSAKELSGQRAEVIREWLIAQGISPDRVEVKAWGGRRMIYDKNSANARKNVRVEVEVLSE